MPDEMNEVLADLTQAQLQELIAAHWRLRMYISVGSIMAWRRGKGLRERAVT